MRLASRFFSLLFSFFLSLVCHQVGFITETKELYHRDKRALSQRQKSPITQTKEPYHTDKRAPARAKFPRTCATPGATSNPTATTAGTKPVFFFGARHVCVVDGVCM